MPIQHKNVLFLEESRVLSFFSIPPPPPFLLMNQTVNKCAAKSRDPPFHVPAFCFSLSAALLKWSANTEWYLKSWSETICIGSVWKC